MTRRLIASLVIAVLFSGQLLAYFDRPDPTWIAGFWDDADFDDAIIRSASITSATDRASPSALEPRWQPIRTLPWEGDRLGIDPAFAPRQPRGPPLA